MLSRFYWLIEGVLAGSSRPGVPDTLGAHRRTSPDGDREMLDQHLAWLHSRGIDAILSLTETPLAEEAVARHGLAAYHLPVPDLHAPVPDEFMRALRFIDRQRAEGHAVVVHCLAGQGRTGTVLAAYRIRSGSRPDEAVQELRTICPGAIGSAAQEQALHGFAGRRDWIL